jgi:hypothetical protein
LGFRRRFRRALRRKGAEVPDRVLFVLKGFSKFSDEKLLLFAQHVLEMMSGSSNFPEPVVSMAALAAIIASFQSALTAARDGGGIAVEQKNSIRRQLVPALRQLAIYVQSVADGDPSIIASSGFRTRSQGYRPQPQPAVPRIRKILNGAPEELLVYVNAEVYAKTYNLRFGPASTDPNSWTVRQAAVVKSAVRFKGLTPGVVYGFQVQALGNGGVTDWSDTSTHMSM